MNPVIEGFRGIAALLVMIHHYSYSTVWGAETTHWVHALHSGVDLFFVITGLLFAPYLLGERTLPLAAFGLRRTMRLLPLYVISLLVAVSFSSADAGNTSWALLKHLLFIQTWPMFDLASAGFFSLVYWTLPVEVTFYVLVALVVAVRAYWPPSNTRTLQQQTASDLWRPLALIGTASFSLFALTYLVDYAPQAERWVLWQAQLPALLPQFWLGMLVHVVLRKGFAATMGWYAVGLGAGLWLLLAVLYPFVVVNALTVRPFGWFNLISALAYALMLIGWLGRQPVHAKAGRLNALLVWLGAISYSIYLFHSWTLTLTLRWLPSIPTGWSILLAMGITFAIGMLLHRWVEEPLREWGRQRAKAIT